MNFEKKIQEGNIHIEREGHKPTITYIDLGRHSNRFAGKGEWVDPQTGEVMSFDDSQDLTPEGRLHAKEYGVALPEVDLVIGVGTSSGRTTKTIEDISEGAKKSVGMGPSVVSGITYSEINSETFKRVKSVSKEISASTTQYPNYGRLTPELRAKIRESKQKKGLEKLMQDDAFVDEASEAMGYNIYVLYEFSKHAPDGQKTYMPVINHSAFNESLLKKALIIEDENGNKQIGFDDIKEIGGFFDPAEVRPLL